MDEADGPVDVGRRSLIESDPGFMKRSIDHGEKRLFSTEVVLYISVPFFFPGFSAIGATSIDASV